MNIVYEPQRYAADAGVLCKEVVGSVACVVPKGCEIASASQLSCDEPSISICATSGQSWINHGFLSGNEFNLTSVNVEGTACSFVGQMSGLGSFESPNDAMFGTRTFSLIPPSGYEAYGFIRILHYRQAREPVYTASFIRGASCSGPFTGAATSEKNQSTFIIPLIRRLATISYDANGGCSAPESQSFVPGEELTLTRVQPTKADNTFKGWALTKTATEVEYVPGGKYTFDESTTLYAVWSKNSTLLVYNANGGVVSPSYKEVSVGDTYGSLPSPTKSDATFSGRYTAATGGTRVYSSTVVSSSDVTVIYAHWDESYSFTIRFVDPSGANTTVEKTYSSTATNYLPSPSDLGWGSFASGYTFGNRWESVEGGGGAYFSVGASFTEFYYDTLFASVTCNPVKITLNPNGGSVTPTSITVIPYVQYGNLPTPVRSGHTFKGWYTTATGGVQVTGASVAPSTATTIYAQWNQTEKFIIGNYRIKD